MAQVKSYHFSRGKYVPCSKTDCQQEHIPEEEYLRIVFEAFLEGDSTSPYWKVATQQFRRPPTLEQLQDVMRKRAIYRDALMKLMARSPILPEVVSEGLVALCYDQMIRIKGSGDVVGIHDDNFCVGEVKGSSRPSPSSFSPSEQFQNLWFVQFDEDKQRFNIYDLHRNREAIEAIATNGKQSLKQQAEQARRPRFIIEKEIIEKEGLLPDFTVLMPYDGEARIIKN